MCTYQRRLVVISFVALMAACPSYAQVEVSSARQINRSQDLSDRYIKAMIRDEAGFLWIGTRNGLNRYNGISIAPYDNRYRDDNQISGRDIKNICSTSEGVLIIQYEQNRRFVDVLDTRTSSRAQKLFLNIDNGVHGRVEEIHLSHSKNSNAYLLVSSPDSQLSIHSLGEDQLFKAEFFIKNYRTRPSSRYRFTSLRDGGFIVNDTYAGIIRTDHEGTIVSQISYDTLGLKNNNWPVRILHQDRQGRLWLAFDKIPGIWEYNEAAELYTPFIGLDDMYHYTDLWEDKRGNVIVCQENELGGKKLLLIGNDDVVRDYSNLMGEAPVTTVYGDDFERLLFVGTEDGINVINQRKNQVNQIALLGEEDGAIEPLDVRGTIALSGNRMMLNDEYGRWYEMAPRSDFIRALSMPEPLDDFDADCPCATKMIYDGTFAWSARNSFINGAQLVKYDPASGAFSYYSFPEIITDITNSKSGNLWLVSRNGSTSSRLSEFNVKDGAFYHEYDDRGANPVDGMRAQGIVENELGEIWIGTENGLIQLNIDGKTAPENAKVHESLEGDYYSLSNDHITAISPGRDGRMMIGTKGGGLNVYDPVREEMVYYDTRDGLVGNEVVSMVRDRDQNFWISTTNGLSYYNQDLKLFRNFGTADGFNVGAFNPHATALDSNGVLYFGTSKGLNVFRPADLLEAEINEPVVLSELSYFDPAKNEIVKLQGNLQNGETIELPASNRILFCEFAMVDFAYPEQNQYRYRFEDRDEDWQYLGVVNELRFNDLGPGMHQLIVEGIDRNGNISSRPLRLNIRVDNYFYRKWWFILTMLGLTSLIGYLIHRFRLQRAIELERLRTKISSDLHDDVGGLLSGLAMQTELLEYTANDKDKPKLKRISEMSRSAMAQMRDVIWATDARKDRFEDLLERMKEYSAEMLFPRGIEFYFHIQNINREKKIPVHIRQNVYLIFKEAVTNIAKHSNATKVDIYLHKEGNQFSLDVKNNGTAQQKLNGSARNGSGLLNMEMRAQNINADISIEKDVNYDVSLSMRSFV